MIGQDFFRPNQSFLPRRLISRNPFFPEHRRMMATQKADLDFGFARECANTPRICEHLGVYMLKLNPMNTCDWIECIPREGLPYLAEQKARNVSFHYINQNYGGTVVIGKNKVDAMKAHGEGILYFDLKDALYYIQYDEEVFAGFRIQGGFRRGERQDCYDRECDVVHIPTSLLTKV